MPGATDSIVHPPATSRGALLRPATALDIEAISTIWYRGWRDAHLGHVPDAVRRHRRLADFRRLVPPRIDATTVATTEREVVGFVTVHDDEIEQLYVDAAARGSGVAGALLAHGESIIRARFDRAWLAVVAGNSRARRFYERNGWSNAGPFNNPAPTPDGTTIPVPALRYQKQGEIDRAVAIPGSPHRVDERDRSATPHDRLDAPQRRRLQTTHHQAQHEDVVGTPSKDREDGLTGSVADIIVCHTSSSGGGGELDDS